MSHLFAFFLGMLFAPVAMFGLSVALDRRDRRTQERIVKRNPQPETYEDVYEHR